MRIIVGLGNPGDKYKYTRHNVGFIAVDAIAKQQDLIWQFNKKFNAEIAKAKDTEYPIGHSVSQKTILVKPQTFMNNSGQAIQAIMSYYKLLPHCRAAVSPRGLRRLLFRHSPLTGDCDEAKNADFSGILTVIHDDIDIELGKYKISINSGSAGHKGIQSVINRLKTKNFKRIRIGIKTDSLNKIPVEKFVLQKFNQEETEIIDNLIEKLVMSFK